MSIKVAKVATKPFSDQKPDTSGLRKSVTVFQQPNYTENYIQATVTAGLGDCVRGSTLIVGGDGRYFLQDAVQIIIRITAGNGVGRLIIGQNGILSTPAVSYLIRKYKANAGFILTASHLPGGKNGDFGVKFNMANGGPAPDMVTSSIHEAAKNIQELNLCPDLHCDLDILAVHKFEVEGHGSFVVQVVDSVIDYVELMKEIFDFQAIKRLFAGDYGFSMIIDSMHGVTGPYVKRIFVEELGFPASSVANVDVLEDFGGLHPDPNLTNATALVEKLNKGEHSFGAAFDGDGDRYMILGENAFFVTPGDSLAVLANNLDCVPYFRRKWVKGFGRSLTTTGAVDRVAKVKGKECFEVPTGCKFFSGLMEAGRVSLCGEDSFGTGSEHIREMDGIWAVLAWLQILEVRKKSVRQLLMEHWYTYGRNFSARYDYTGCDAATASKVLAALEHWIADHANQNKTLSSSGKTYTVATADNFSYTDPIDNSVSSKQGIRILFTDGSRIVFRLSGCDSSGTTISIYMDGYENDSTMYEKTSEDILRPLIDIALSVSRMKELAGRKLRPVIT